MESLDVGPKIIANPKSLENGVYLLPQKAALLTQCSLQTHSPQTKRVARRSPVSQYQLHQGGQSAQRGQHAHTSVLYLKQ